MSQSPTKHLDREEIAKREIGQTEISRGMSLALVAGFLFVLVSVPLAQQIGEGLRGETPQALSIFQALPDAARAFAAPKNSSLLDRIFAANGVLLRAMDHYETELEDRSFLAEYFIPRMQEIYARWMGLGNEQAYLGREGWLYYRPGVDYLTGPGFLDPAFQKRRALSGDASVGDAVQPDPLTAIVDFRNQLKQREIHLILLPVPVKGIIEPEKFSGRYDFASNEAVQNSSFADFLSRLGQADVDVLDPTVALGIAKEDTGQNQFLKTDTHWTPEAMERVAGLLAKHIENLDEVNPSTALSLTRGEEVVSGDGDVAAMLKLPVASTLYPAQEVQIHPVAQPDGAPWEPDASASILLLGDSFSNIYSLDAMGWGASAGLAEQLSYLLQRPVDAIQRNDAGAFATRERLAKDLAQGNDRLSGKRVVVWEFAMRELSVGDWKIISLPLVAAATAVTTSPAPSEVAGFYVPPPSELREVEGTVQSRSVVPRPGTVPYKDQVFAVHLMNLTGENIPTGSQAVVYLSGMIDNKLTEASGWKVGQRVQIRLQDWNDVATKYERLNRSELDDLDLQMEAPSWGEPTGSSAN